MNIDWGRASTRLLAPAGGLLLTVVLLCLALRARGGSAPGVDSSHAAPVPPGTPHIAAEGELVARPDAEVTLASDLAGTLVHVLVREGDLVKKGQRVAELRSQDYRAAQDAARARVAQADADLALFDQEVERAHRLWSDDLASKQSYDRAVRDRDAARGRRAEAEADVERLEAIIEKTQIRAPIDGTVIARFAESGETVDVGHPIVTVADLARTRVEAEVDEYDAGRVRVGAQAVITAEGLTGMSWAGTVEEVPHNITNRELKPQDPGRPVDVGVLRVKIHVPAGTPLKLGQRVDVEIRTAG